MILRISILLYLLIFDECRQADALKSLVGNQERLFGVANASYPTASVMTLAEIRYRRQQNGILELLCLLPFNILLANDDEILIAVGKYRLKLKKLQHVNGKVLATGCIFEDASINLPQEVKKVVHIGVASAYFIAELNILAKIHLAEI